MDLLCEKNHKVQAGIPDYIGERGAKGSLGPDCPSCGHDRSHVLDRRDGVRRRRVCGSCGARFTTYEVTSALPHKLAQRLHKARQLIGEVLSTPSDKEGGA